MKISHATLLAFVLPLGLAAQQQTSANPITAAFTQRITGLHRNIAQAFDSIPESKFGYKPTPAQLSIGYIAQHVASDDYLFCTRFGTLQPTLSVEDTATADSVKAKWPKDKLVSKLKESLKYCDDAIAQVDDAKLAEQVSVSFGRGPARQFSRAFMVLGHALDLSDHYSQLANYMRLNGITPPSALPRPGRGGN
jgi:DinB family protein